MTLEPIDIASIVASVASIIVAYIGLKSARANSVATDELSDQAQTAHNRTESYQVLIVCFFIYSVCGLLSGALGWWSSYTAESTWGSTNLIWVVGNSIIAFLLYKKYISKTLL